MLGLKAIVLDEKSPLTPNCKRTANYEMKGIPPSAVTKLDSSKLAVLTPCRVAIAALLGITLDLKDKLKKIVF